MLGSNVEETNEQTRRRETEPTARGMGKKDKSLDAIVDPPFCPLSTCPLQQFPDGLLLLA